MASTITQIPSWVEWKLLETSKEFEGIGVSFQKIDKTHTRVIIAEADAALKTELEKVESDLTEISVVKDFDDLSSATSIDKPSIDITSVNESDRSFTITHPDKLEAGWKFKIGTASVTIGTSTSADAFKFSVNNYCHQDTNGNNWVAFFDGTNPVLYVDNGGWGQVTTPDGSNSLFDSDGGTSPSAVDWSIFWDGDDLYCVCNIPNGAHFEHYTLNANGTVTKDTDRDETVGDFGSSGCCAITLDHDGEIVIQESFGAGSSRLSVMYVSSTTVNPFDTWTSRGSPSSLFHYANGYKLVDIGDVGDGADLALIGFRSGTHHYDSSWNDSGPAWLNVVAHSGNNDGNPAFDAVRTSDGKVHFVFKARDDNIYTHTGADVGNDAIGHRAKGIEPADGWTTRDVDVAGVTTPTKLTLCAHGAELFIFYDKGDEKIYHRNWTSGGGWGAEVNTIKTDVTAILGAISCFYNSVSNEIGICWIEESGGVNDNVEFAILSLLPPTTAPPTTVPPTTLAPTTLAPTTLPPTTTPPTTSPPTTLAPTTVAPPTTTAPTTVAPTTVPPTTSPPTTTPPTTSPPTTLAPTTLAPPTTVAPTTLPPTTVSPTTAPPTTSPPTTLAPTTLPKPTLAPTTVAPTTIAPTTIAPTTQPPTTLAPTTILLTTSAPTTAPPFLRRGISNRGFSLREQWR